MRREECLKQRGGESAAYALPVTLSQVRHYWGASGLECRERLRKKLKMTLIKETNRMPPQSHSSLAFANTRTPVRFKNMLVRYSRNKTHELRSAQYSLQPKIVEYNNPLP